MGSQSRIHRAKQAAGRFVVCWGCSLASSGAIAQIIQAPPLPAQGAAAVTWSAAAAGAPIAGRAASSSGSDIDRYEELADIGGTPDAPADPASLREAYLRYCQAAGTGSTDALVRMGWMHLNGLGVEQDDGMAGALLRRAAAYGSQMAGQLLLMVDSREENLPDCLGTRTFARIDVAPARPVTKGGDRVARPARFATSAPSVERQKLAARVVRLAGEFGLDPRLVMGLIGVESNFDPSARSPKNAAGLMQLIPETAARFKVADPLDPEQNLRGGMAYLRWLLSYYRGDVILALAAYNAGERAVDRHRGVPPYAETMAYVQRIQAMYPSDRHAFDPRLAAASPALDSSVPDRASGFALAEVAAN